MDYVNFKCPFDGTLTTVNTVCMPMGFVSPLLMQDWTNKCPVCGRYYYQGKELVGVK